MLKRLAMDCYYIPGSGFCSNIYFLYDKNAAIVIDTGDGSIDVRDEIKIEPDIIILTHGHADHTNGVKIGWSAFLRKEDFIPSSPYHVPEGTKPLKFTRRSIGSFDFEIMHTPGHTPGSICIYERKRKLLFTGDLLFSDGSIGRTDLIGGSDKAMHNSLRKILSRFSKKKAFQIPLKLDLNVSVLCPGHGNVTTYV